MATKIEQMVAELETRRSVFVGRGQLWAEYVRDCDIMIARLRAGLPLTEWQLGKAG